jgi:UDP-galactopyranose mutase
MTRWARDCRVFFVEEPIFDATSAYIDVRAIEGNLHLVVPHLPPGLSSEGAERKQQELVDTLVARERLRDPIAWYYTPMAIEWSRHLRPSVTVYDCMDELSHFQGAPPVLVERERILFERADLVFTGGQSLYEAKRRHHPRVHAFPSSVDAEHFASARAHRSDGGDEPADQASIPRPRLGFFGVIDERMDLELLRRVAELRPDLSLVMIGPTVKIDPATLPQLPNIHWLGSKSYADLPAYLAGWDVAIMPFARNDATKFISPTKTLEYLAAGKPVVSTSIRDVVRPYGEQGLARIADEPHAFVAAVAEALWDVADNPERDAFVALTSWDKTFSRMRALVLDVLARRAPRTHDVRASARRPAFRS